MWNLEGSGHGQFDILFHRLPRSDEKLDTVFHVDNIRMYLGEVGWGDVDWIGLAKDRNRWRAVVNSVLNLWVP
jgi:hypothetical protein